LRTTQDDLEQQKQNKDYLELDIKNLRQQLEYAQDELYKQKTNLHNRIQEREIEIERLRTQVQRSYITLADSITTFLL
jgi:hypothetical protein